MFPTWETKDFSLIGVVAVKLFVFGTRVFFYRLVRVGHTLLFAGGARRQG